MRSLLRILQPAMRQRRWMAGGILLGVLVVAANAALMAVSGWFIASMAVAGVAKVSFNFFFPSAAIRLLAIIRTVGRYVERLVTHEAAFHILTALRVWLFNRLIPQSPAGLERYAAGDLAGRLRADVDSLENLYLRILAPLGTGLFSIVLAGLFTTYFSPVAAVMLMGLLLLAGLALPLVMRRLAELPGRYSTELAGELRSQVTQGLQGAEELLLLGAVEQQSAVVERLSCGLVTQQVRLGRLAGATLAGITLAGGLAMVLVALVLIPEVRQQALNGPQLVMLLLFTMASFEAVGPLAQSLQLIPAVQEAARRIYAVADAPPPLPEPVVSAVPQGYRVEMRQVCCSYGGNQPVLTQFSLTLAEGERLAVLGPSGSGKSTLLELLLRFRPYQGSITIGGCELQEIGSDHLTRQVSALPQQPHLFDASIRENILLGRELDEGQLAEILSDCCLQEWIASLPLGLDTPVGGGGSEISGGEARRIALARALVAGTPVLLLDEPTEGLDTVTEQVLVQRLARRLTGKSVLVATHRPAALALAQRVVRLENRI